MQEEIVLTPREKEILKLLAEGRTTASTARHLGVSTRTVSYSLRALMDRLDVKNRFQLGIVLGAADMFRTP